MNENLDYDYELKIYRLVTIQNHHFEYKPISSSQ